MNRLGWICSLAVLAGGATTAFGAPAAQRHYNIGLELYTVRDDCAKDFEGVIRAVGKMGYTGVEFAGYYGRSAQELRKWLDEDHLKCYGSHISIDELSDQNFDKTVAFAKVLGNKLLVVPSIPYDRRKTRDALLETCKFFNDRAKRLEKEGIMLGYHNHMDEFKPMDGEMPWYTFFANTDSKVKIQFDIGNALQGGVQALPFLTKYPGRVVSIHVKDFSSKNPNALLGEGEENWKDVIPVIKGKTGTRWYIIEQEGYPFPPMECAEKCLHTFQRMMSEK